MCSPIVEEVIEDYRNNVFYGLDVYKTVDFIECIRILKAHMQNL